MRLRHRPDGLQGFRQAGMPGGVTEQGRGDQRERSRHRSTNRSAMAACSRASGAGRASGDQ